MSEENTNEGATGATGPAGGGNQPEFKAPASQEEFDRMVGDRIARERAKYADYEDLKAKAAKLDAAEEASKSEAEKAKERAEAAERRADLAEKTALRTRIAAETGVPVEALKGDDEESIKASAQRIVEWAESNKRAAPKPSSLKSGASAPAPDTGEKGRAAAAVRALRQG